MNDYNFFENYTTVKEKRSVSVQVTMLICALVLLGLAFYGFQNFRSLESAKEKLADLDTELMTLKLDQDIIRVIDKTELEGNLADIVTKIDLANQDIQNRVTVEERMLILLADTLPMDVSLTNFAINGPSITANGSADTKPAIAEFEYNLRHSKDVTDVTIGSISKREGEDEDGYSFNISIGLTAGGTIDENQ